MRVHPSKPRGDGAPSQVTSFQPGNPSGAQEPILFSVIVPAYRQEATIAQDVRQLTEVLDAGNFHYEVILVVDGRVDATAKRAQDVGHPRVRVVEFEHNVGKGNAVRHGFLLARGEVVAFIDAGMDIDPKALLDALALQYSSGADIVIGSKRHPLSRVAYPRLRRIYSAGYQLLTRVFFGFDLRDTQVGMKLFRREVVDVIAPRLLVKRFAFDVEVLAVAYLLGYRRIREVPVTINHATFMSTIRMKNIFEMLWDTLAVWYRIYVRNYYTDVRWQVAAMQASPKGYAKTGGAGQTSPGGISSCQ
jgi:glycosyltransferase involved in cell wall biosynthesis